MEKTTSQLLSQIVFRVFRRWSLTAVVAGLGVALGAASGCSSSSSQSVVDGGVGLVSGPADDHCAAAEPIMTSQASCHPPADAGAPDGGAEPAPAIRYNGEADDDDCKYHVVFSSTPVAKNQNVTLSVAVTKLAENNAPASNAMIVIESFLGNTHPLPNSDYKTTESPAGSGKYTVGPVKFDETGTWTLLFHFYESCEDKFEDSPHGHVTFYFNVP
jgi:hypothetical protein